MADPWMKFYPSDWMSEPKLKLVSRAARSLWIDMICLMHQSGTGRLEVSGRPMTEKELSAILGDNPRTVKKLVAELHYAGVSTVVDGSFIASSRVIREFKKVERDRSNGRMGGNPALKNNGLDENGVNPPVKAQKLEARSYKLEEEKKEKTADEPEAVSFSDFWKVWPCKTAKVDAEKAWRKATPENRKAAYEAAKGGWFNRWQSENPKLNPIHPASYLNGKRWEDVFQSKAGKPMAREDGDHAGAFGFIPERG
tara:strand:- start:121 stop:882 length:762 start_codon:yes stop_codon:yes gene_type:complete